MLFRTLSTIVLLKRTILKPPETINLILISTFFPARIMEFVRINIFSLKYFLNVRKYLSVFKLFQLLNGELIFS